MTVAAPMSPAFCKQVGHWRVSKEVIGNGTTSTVQLASHTTVPTLCAAVKIISRTSLLIKAEGDPTALHLADAVIHREVLLMKLASHERIVKLYDFVGHGDLAYMILEHAPNKTLFDLFRSHSSFLPTPLITHLFSQLMQAVGHIHSLHIVHRDIKLENIFLFGPDVKDVLQTDSTHVRNHKLKDILPHKPKDASTPTRNASPPPYTALTLKLGDFGLSHTHSPTALSTVFHGSPHYQAPELWARVPHRAFPTDVWSAGIVLYALVGRRLPFGVGELEEWGGVFCKRDDPDELRVETEHEHKHGYEMDEKEYTDRPPIPRPGVPSHMPYDVPEVMPPTIEHLLQRIFSINPAMRPTSREILADALFGVAGYVSPRQDVSALQGNIRHASGHPMLSQQPITPPPQYIAEAHEPQDLYDLATLCTPPSTHVPRATFRGSSLERRVRRLLLGEACIERVWASRLAAWAAWEGEECVGACERGKRVLEKGNERGNEKGQEKERKRSVEKERRVEPERKVGWGERKGWSKSLGRIKGADVRAHLAASIGHLGHAGQREHAEQVAPAVPAAQRGHGEHEKRNPVVLKPKVRAPFRSLRIKTEPKPSEIKHNVAYRPSPLPSPVASPVNAAPTRELPPILLKPKLSFRTLRPETSDPRHAHSTVHTVLPLVQPPSRTALQSPLVQTFASRNDSAATSRSRHDAASTLQSRHDALLRRAYELGFGTQDLKAFAEEAGRIVRNAKGGTTENSEFTAIDGERGAITPTEGSSSTATTLVPESGEGEQKSGMSLISAHVPVLKVVDIQTPPPTSRPHIDMNVDITFDVDFETDLRWI